MATNSAPAICEINLDPWDYIVAFLSFVIEVHDFRNVHFMVLLYVEQEKISHSIKKHEMKQFITLVNYKT